MSLIAFHKLLIATAALFCAGFAGWQVFVFTGGASASSLVIGVAFALGAVALVVYLSRLDRVLGRRPHR